MSEEESIQVEDQNSVVVYDQDENEERGNWTGRFDFILSCIGYAVGLGNVWRFPHLCYKNGGGAFLIPYIVMLAVAGLPLFYFELSFGQFSNLGPLTIWRVQPMFKGIGYSMIIISALVCIYYNVIIAWAFYYLFVSLDSKVPWASCNNTWNYDGCMENFNEILTFNDSRRPCRPNSNITTMCTKYTTPAEQYWLSNVLGFVNANGANREFSADLGEINYKLAMCLLLSWIIVCMCLINGVKSSGKVVYFTALFPYIVIIIMVINGALLDGAIDGIRFYIIPDWEKMLTAQIWGEAATQIFYSLGISFGSLITMASFNRFHNNCYRDAIIVSLVNCGTSIFAGFAIFSVLGYMSKRTGLSIEDASTSGSGLTFVAYAEGIAQMPAAPFWAILFFLMLLTLGLDSQFGLLEAVLSGLEDEFPALRANRRSRFGFKIAMCSALFLLGLPLVSEGGMYYFTLLDKYAGGISLMITCFCEVIVISYFYGIKNFARDIKMILSYLPSPYWIGCWMFISPIVILAIILFYITQYAQTIYNGKTFPPSADSVGWLITVCSILAIPIYFVYYWIRYGLTIKPAPEWGPPVEKFWYEDIRYQKKLEARENFDNFGHDNEGNVATPL